MKHYITKIEVLRPSSLRYRLLCIMLLTVIVCAGCESAKYSEKATELNDLIDMLLISEKLCKDKNDCNIKQYVLYEYAKGIYISAYGITDQSIVKKIVSLCIDAHAKNPMVHYELHVHHQTKEETLKGKKKTTMLELILNKEE